MVEYFIRERRGGSFVQVEGRTIYSFEPWCDVVERSDDGAERFILPIVTRSEAEAELARLSKGRDHDRLEMRRRE